MCAEILIGTRGWDHDEWVGDYYPEELPDDWRLCYYSNQYRAVLVPAPAWAVVDAGVVEAWMEDSDPEFRFVLEPPPEVARAPESWRAFLDLIGPLGPRTAGLFWSPPPSVAGDGSALVAILERLRTALPVCVDLPGGVATAEQRRILETLACSLCWRPQQVPAPDTGGDFLLALTGEADAGRQRALLEALDAWGGDHAVAVLIFEGRQAPERARQARVLAELLGL